MGFVIWLKSLFSKRTYFVSYDISSSGKDKSVEVSGYKDSIGVIHITDCREL